MAFENYRKISLEDMISYIETDAPTDKAWFKSVALDENGKYQHLIAVRAFCGKYMPQLLPVKKPAVPNKSDILKNW